MAIADQLLLSGAVGCGVQVYNAVLGFVSFVNALPAVPASVPAPPVDGSDGPVTIAGTMDPAFAVVLPWSLEALVL